MTAKRRKVVMLVQARIGSERLPAKVLAELDGSSVLEHVMEALSKVADADGVALVIPRGDTALATIAGHAGWPVLFGPEQDVLARFNIAAHETGADAVVRITADCPLLDSTVVDDAIQRWRAEPCDYLSVDGYPIGIGDVEIFDRQALVRAAGEAVGAAREHLGYHFRDHPADFRTVLVEPPPDLRRQDLRLCIDEPADLDALRRLLDQLPSGSPRDARTLIEFLDAHPEIVAINEHVKQRS